MVIEIIAPAIKADDSLAPNLQEIKLEANKVEKTNPITGKKLHT